MSVLAGVGFSKNIDTLKAIHEAAEQAKKNLSQTRIDAAIIFNTIHYDPKIFLPIAFRALDHTKLLGCSTGGIILADGIQTRGIGIIAIYADEIKFESSHVSHLNMQDTYQAGKTLAKQVMSDFGSKRKKMLLLLVENLSIDTENLLNSIAEHTGNTSIIFGAGSCDNFSLNKTYQYYQDITMSKGVTGLFIGGPLQHIAISCRHGWKPLGKLRNVDAVDKKTIKTINKKKAVNIYEEFFAEEANTLSQNAFGHLNIRYPLGMKIESSNEYLIRHVVEAQKDGSLVCQNNVAKDSKIHIMIGNRESCLLAAEDAALDIKKQLKGRRPSLIIVMESIARYKILGRTFQQEIQIIQNTLGKSIPILGMCSYGEIFTVKKADNTFQTLIQNGSLLVLAIS